MFRRLTVPRRADSVFTTFETRATEVSAEVHRVTTRDQALDQIEAQLRAEGVQDRPSRYAVWAPCPFLDTVDREALAARIPGLSFEATAERAAAARVGISQVDWAIADTGSIAQDATDIAQRLVSTLPPVHLALLPADRIVPDLATYLTVQRPADLTYLSLITGPSRTADIERVLTIGVHGPARLIILVVEQLEGAR
jgi:L-lactate dehydrogenase complex protein LldG